MNDVKVGDIMTQDPVSVSKDTLLMDCARLMVKRKVGSVVVKENNKIEGMVSHSDVLWAFVKTKGSNLSDVKVGDIARRKIYVLHPEDSVEKAMLKMNKLKLRRMPVISKGEVVGLLTVKDLLVLNPALSSALNELADVRESTEKLNALKSITNDRRFVHEGICQECGDTDILSSVEGRMVCSRCQEDL